MGDYLRHQYEKVGKTKMKNYKNKKFKSKPKKLNWFQRIVKKVKQYFI